MINVYDAHFCNGYKAMSTCVMNNEMIYLLQMSRVYASV